jgi:RimJ/RimL family protein N-acetyltransferase
MNAHSFPLTDGVLILRAALPADARALYAAIQESLGEVPRWLPGLNAELTVTGIGTWITAGTTAWAEGTAYNCVITEAAGGRVLGGCGLTHVHPSHRFANLYYWVRTSATGQGVATRAVRLLAAFGFAHLGLQRVEILVEVGNTPSTRVAAKAGAHEEGRLRNRLYIYGQPRDAHMFSLIPSDMDG